ncbi:MAG: hypothetical protein JXA33_11365 [Anaerolineae bacterium]|nr:hypothetical protein [Anaerolineae bacterium]
MREPICLSVAERLYGLSLIWQEANYNFAFFNRVPDLDWDACYREYMSQIISVEDLYTYYKLLSKFTAHLKDGHTLVVPPKSLHLSLDRPKLMLMNIANTPVVTNASCAVGNKIPIGSELLAVDGIEAKEYLALHVIPVVCETTYHRRLDHATARLLLGYQGSEVHCKFHTPSGNSVEIDLLRNRRINTDPWLRPPGLPDKWEFMYFDEWFFNEAPFTAFEFSILEGNVAYIALNSFMDPTIVTSFTEKLPTIRECSGLILDLRKNHGGNDAIGYSIASHFLRQPTEILLVRSPKHIASHKASDASQTRRMHEESWGNIQPSQEILPLPTVMLTDSETGSAAEDFIMALQSGKGEVTRIGRGTAGSTGQPLIQALPGGGKLAICTIQMPWPEEVWDKGIEPHIYVEPAIEDVLQNEDRILKMAMRFLLSH